MGERLKVNLIKQTPIKIFKTTIKYDHHLNDLCKFLKNNKDKKIKIIINEKSIKFNSLADKQKFVSGLMCGKESLSEHTKTLFKELSTEINKLKRENESLKNKINTHDNNILNKNNTIQKLRFLMSLRTEAYQDRIDELTSCLDILKDRL